jgi:hypothetical protein
VEVRAGTEADTRRAVTVNALSQDRPLFVAITADVDPDANQPVLGRADAVSAVQTDGEVSLDGCFQGLAALLDVLERLALPATLFWEARTLSELGERRPGLLRRAVETGRLEHGCHGYCHEDFAGVVSGLQLSSHEVSDVLEKAGQVFSRAFGRRPQGFRAPYCRLTAELGAALAAAGYSYDASLTRPASARWPLTPYRLTETPELWELPLCRSRDRDGQPISSYLWQLFEGNRQPEDYVFAVEKLRDGYAGGLMQVALHPWHLIVSADGRPLGEVGGATGPEALANLVERLTEMPGIRFSTAGAYLEEWLSRQPGSLRR